MSISGFNESELERALSFFAAQHERFARGAFLITLARICAGSGWCWMASYK